MQGRRAAAHGTGLSRRAVLCGGLSSLSWLGLGTGNSFAQRGHTEDLHQATDEKEWAHEPHDGGPISWNRLLRRTVIADRWDPPYASRIYAYVTLAQACAVAATPARRAPLVRVALSAAALEVAPSLLRRSRLPAAGYEAQTSSDAHRDGASSQEVSEAAARSTQIARRVAARAARDGAEIPSGTPPRRAHGIWQSDGGRPPVRPRWGDVSPLLVDHADFPMQPPPPTESPEFRAALREVAERVRHITAADTRLVALWADGAGTSTPPGHWNRIACGLLCKHGVDEGRAVEVLAVLNLALFDAGILCWRVKFEHWLARPHQMDPAILPLVSVPNFPAYPSGHSAFSGAAAEVLGHSFPTEREALTALATEASESRVAGGIHYPFDCQEGLRIGRWVGTRATRAWLDRKGGIAGPGRR